MLLAYIRTMITTLYVVSLHSYNDNNLTCYMLLAYIRTMITTLHVICNNICVVMIKALSLMTTALDFVDGPK